MLTQARVRELFDYREDGCLIRKVATGKTHRGAVAGCPSHHGYFIVGVNKRYYLLHRLVFLYHHGYLPENHVDHIDRDRSNNRIENLREVSHTCNLRNTGNHCTNTSGIKGVSWDASKNKWTATIMVSKRSFHLGRFTDFTEAVAHRLAAEQALAWGSCDSCSPAFQYMQNYLRDAALSSFSG